MTNGTTTPTDQPQMGLDGEEPLNDPEINAALEKWYRAEAGLTAARDEERDAMKMLQAIVSQKELDDGTYRAGRFVVTISNVSAHQRVRPKLAKT